MEFPTMKQAQLFILAKQSLTRQQRTLLGSCFVGEDTDVVLQVAVLIPLWLTLVAVLSI